MFPSLRFPVASSTAENADTRPPLVGLVAPSLELPRKRNFGCSIFRHLEVPMAIAISSLVLYYTVIGAPAQILNWEKKSLNFLQNYHVAEIFKAAGSS